MEPSTRSAKRPRTPPNAPPSDQKKPRLSSSPSNVRDETLRIATQMLRGENRQLLEDRDALEKSKAALSERLAQTQRSLRDLEDDIARLYRQKQKDIDAQRREFEQKLQEATGRPEESKEIKSTTIYSTQTTKEIDKFLQSCERWRTRFTAINKELAIKTEKVATHEVQSVMRDLVTSVETKTLQNEAERKQTLLQWATWIQEDTAKCLEESNRQIQDTEAFEAMERQLMADRVVELETQLAQKKTVEKEKEMELSSLRAAEEDQVVSKKEVAALKKRMAEELDHMKKKMETVKKENATLTQENEKLAQETQQLREKQKRDVEQVEEVKKLQEKLRAFKARDAKMTVALKAAEKEIEKSKQRKDELKILYAKFSTTMDSVLEKTMRLEELEQELSDAQSSRRDIETHKEGLEKQVTQLQQENASLSTAHREKEKELDKMQTLFREQESQQKKIERKMEELKAQNEALKLLQVKQEHQSVGEPSKEQDKRSADSDSTLVIQVAEKEALQMFIQRYCSKAEEKYRRLLKKISKLESQQASTQEQTKEACTVVRMCIQVDSCDGSIRASLLNLLATLESLT